MTNHAGLLHPRTRGRSRPWAVAVPLLLVVCLVLAPVALADCPLYRLPTNRFGVDMNVRFGRITDYDVAALHISWYSDWAASQNPLRPGGVEYVQLIWVYQGQWFIDGVPAAVDRLYQLVDANPGATWIIGNEPECPYGPGGGKMTPAQYGAVYHTLYYLITGRDPSARIAVGGVVVPTPLRLQWLNQLLTYYQTTYGEPMPVHVWTTHLIILPEMGADCPVSVCGLPEDRWGCGVPVGLSNPYGTMYETWQHGNVEIFKALVVSFRTWMRDHGYRDRPLIISEYGILLPADYGYTSAAVKSYMYKTFDYMLTKSDTLIGYPADKNLLVQRWAWNSLNDQPYDYDGEGGGFNGGLFDHLDNTFPGTMTDHGKNYASYTTALLTGPACITGTVHLEARPAIPHASHVTTATLTLLPVDCPQPDIRSVTTGNTGVFTVCSVLTGTYNITVKGFNTLATRTLSVTLPSGKTSVDLGLLRSGDANNDNYVTILDFSILVASYGSTLGSPTYDLRADFNNDGRVDILDFSLLATHFSEVGAR